MNHTKSQINKLLMNIESFRWNVALKSLLVGLLAGMLAAFYRFATEKGTDFAVSFYSYIKIHPSAIIIWIVLALIAGLFIAWLIKLEPMASGGGVPQVEGVILYGLKMKWHMVIAVRYLAGILGSLFGLSFGPEGSSIQFGAAIGQGISSKICKIKMEKTAW